MVHCAGLGDPHPRRPSRHQLAPGGHHHVPSADYRVAGKGILNAKFSEADACPARPVANFVLLLGYGRGKKEEGKEASHISIHEKSYNTIKQ